MKTRICLILLSLMVILPVSGCGRSAQKPAPEPTFAEEPSPTRYTTRRRRNPQTGRIETVRVPVQTKADEIEQQPTRYTTQRRRNPQTGRIETVRVPVRTEADEEQPCEPDAEAAQPAVRRAAAARARAVAEPKPDASKENHFKLDWQEPCSVQEAYSAACWVFETLGLAEGVTDQTSQRLYHPQTGQVEARRIPRQTRDGRWDELSALLKGKSTSGIAFEVDILLLPPDASRIMITATSDTQSEDILEQQAGFLRHRISEVIHQKPEEEPVPYPQTLIFHQPVQTVYDAIYNAWAMEHQLEFGSSGRDKYYKEITCEAGSGIRFRFTLRLVGPDETRLDMNVSNYQGKEEFGMILAGLMEVLDGLGDNMPQHSQDENAGRPVYPENVVLNQSVERVGDAIHDWIEEMDLDMRFDRGDLFSRHIQCRTASDIWLTFMVRQIAPNKSKLTITSAREEGKEEFPMIMKSLKEALAGLKDTQTDTGQEAADGEDVFIVP